MVTKFKIEGAKGADYFPRNFTFFGTNNNNCLDESKWEFQACFQDSTERDNLMEAELDNIIHQYRYKNVSKKLRLRNVPSADGYIKIHVLFFSFVGVTESK